MFMSMVQLLNKPSIVLEIFNLGSFEVPDRPKGPCMRLELGSILARQGLILLPSRCKYAPHAIESYITKTARHQSIVSLV